MFYKEEEKMKKDRLGMKEELMGQKRQLLNIYKGICILKHSSFFNHIQNSVDQSGVEGIDDFALFNLYFTMPRTDEVENQLKTMVEVITVKINELEGNQEGTSNGSKRGLVDKNWVDY